MSTTNMLPPITLIGTVSNYTETGLWTFADANDPWINLPYKWAVTINLASPQLHGSINTRVPMSYDMLDIVPGMWIGDIVSGRAVRIIRVLPSSTATVLQVEVEDVERYNIFTDPAQSGFGGVDGAVLLFKLNENGLPILTALSFYYDQFSINPLIITELETKFKYRNYATEFIRVYQPNHGFVQGEPIVLNDTVYNKAASISSHANRVIGIVSSARSPNENWFAYKPIGPVIENLIHPLPGTNGAVLYVDSITHGGVTVEKPLANAIPIYIRLSANSAIVLSRNISEPQDKLDGNRPPATTDDRTRGFAIGSVWIDAVNQKTYTCISTFTNAAVWVDNTPIATGTGIVSHAIIRKYLLNAALTDHIVNHNLNTMDFTYTVFDETNHQIIPNEVIPLDVNTIRFNFTQAFRGRVIISFAV